MSDLDATVTALRDAGVTVSGPVDGLISGAKSVLALDHDGAVIELAEAPSDKPGAEFAGIRIAAIDAVATGEFLTAIGFAEAQASAHVERGPRPTRAWRVARCRRVRRVALHTR